MNHSGLNEKVVTCLIPWMISTEHTMLTSNIRIPLKILWSRNQSKLDSKIRAKRPKLNDKNTERKMSDTCVPRDEEGASNTAVVEYFGGDRGGGAET